MKDAPQENPRNQYAALPFREDGALEVMLVSSRETRRWILPKGWPMKGRKPHGTAAREALEEAGLVGKMGKEPVGTYHYLKRRKNGSSLLCRVTVFPMRVQRQRKSWPEKDQRVTRWFAIEEAADLVQEPELQEVIRNFEKLASENPDALPKLGPPPPLVIDGPSNP
jgi:8-oxo-dGTP pyrophosphatase MutT (NUDIX family)